jgi:hypothetical protein
VCAQQPLPCSAAAAAARICRRCPTQPLLLCSATTAQIIPLSRSSATAPICQSCSPKEIDSDYRAKKLIIHADDALAFTGFPDHQDGGQLELTSLVHTIHILGQDNNSLNHLVRSNTVYFNCVRGQDNDSLNRLVL